jgi:hypothetical protein
MNLTRYRVRDPIDTVWVRVSLGERMSTTSIRVLVNVSVAGVLSRSHLGYEWDRAVVRVKLPLYIVI